MEQIMTTNGTTIWAKQNKKKIEYNDRLFSDRGTIHEYKGN
jgi:hypothetical protein